MTKTYIFENPSCKECEYWEPNTNRHIDEGRCQHLDNDFCCGGRIDGREAGCLGGGNFTTKSTFWCKFWSQK